MDRLYKENRIGEIDKTDKIKKINMIDKAI
jgi:hypothetical protein